MKTLLISFVTLTSLFAQADKPSDKKETPGTPLSTDSQLKYRAIIAERQNALRTLELNKQAAQAFIEAQGKLQGLEAEERELFSVVCKAAGIKAEDCQIQTPSADFKAWRVITKPRDAELAKAAEPKGGK